MFEKSAYACLALLSPLVFASLAFTQTQQVQEPAVAAASEAQLLEEKRKRLRAIDLVESAAADASQWDDKQTAVRVLADAADLLWDQNSDQARKWLLRAWALTQQVSESPLNEGLTEFFSQSAQTESQTYVLRVARHHDAMLVEKFLNQLADRTPENPKRRGAFDDRSARSAQFLRLAEHVLSNNPELAVTLAEASLSDGISYGLQNVLTRLRRTRPELANYLFDLALATFSSRASDAVEAEVLAGYLFRSGFTFSTDGRGQTILVVNPNQQEVPPVAPAEPERARRFLSAVYQQLLSRQVSDSSEGKMRARQIVLLTSRLLEQYRQFAPELLPSAQGFLTQLQRETNTGDLPTASRRPARQKASESTQSLSDIELNARHISVLEARADEETDPVAKKLAYVEAALAVRPGDYRRARKIAEKINDDELRADVISFILYRAALSHVKEKELNMAEELAPEISDKLRRAVVSIAIAQALLGDEQKTPASNRMLNRQRAFDLVINIDRDLRGTKSAHAAKILLSRCAVLGQLDRTHAMTSLEQSIQIINGLKDFDFRDNSAPDLSLNASSSSSSTVFRPRGFNFSSAIQPLIVDDFDQIAGMVERLARPDLSGVARLEVARVFLERKPAKKSTPKSSRQP